MKSKSWQMILLSIVQTVSFGSFSSPGRALASSSADDDWQPLTNSEKAGLRYDHSRYEAPVRIKPPPDIEYREAIRNAANMTSNSQVNALAQRQGLNVLNVTWEDTGRYKGSSVGPNISDMTIQVAVKKPNGSYDLSLMPVIRYPNFSDKTADVDPSLFTLLVGNESGRDLKRISLREFLEDPTRFLHNSSSWRADKKSLLVERDKKVLVSAQASFLPVPKEGKAEFNPVLFNYQSYSGNPAVLSILVTRQGTSTTIIDNRRNSFSGGWGQRLFHNENGERASLTGQRVSDFAQTEEGRNSSVIKNQINLDVKKSSGLNMVLLIQVPLKQNERQRFKGIESGADMSSAMGGAPMAALANKSMAEKKSDVEAAVISHGEVEGPFTEIDNLKIERDTRFPIRVTVQFYKATATGQANEEDLKQIKQEIDSVYANGDAVGSLVVAGDTGRITEYEGAKVQPDGWWEDFWNRHYLNTGETREESIRKLLKLMGSNFKRMPVCELYLNQRLRRGE